MVADFNHVYSNYREYRPTWPKKPRFRFSKNLGVPVWLLSRWTKNK